MSDFSLIQELLRRFAAAPDAVAFSLYDGEQVRDITYRRFTADILRSAGYFRPWKRQHIALCGEGGYRWFVSFFGIVLTGNIPLPLNPALPAEELMGYCRKTGTALICGDAAAREALSLPALTWLPFAPPDGTAPLLPEAVYSDDPAETMVLLCTSGTTGKSKVVELSYQNFFYCLSDFAEAILPGDRVLSGFPPYHIGGLFTPVAYLWAQQTFCFGRGVRYLFADMASLHPTRLGVVPAMAETLLKVLRRAKTPEERKQAVGSALRQLDCAGANLNPSLCQELLALGIRLRTLYGMTECTAVAVGGYLDELPAGSIGKPTRHTLVRIQDGELLIQSPLVMKGYYADPEETAAVIRDGWLYTGDLGRCDENGCYFITGRRKNVIILSNGENVNPEEIEATLCRCACIAECLIYSDGRGICADIYTDDPDAAERCVDAYNDTVPTYRQVYRVNCSRQPLPKTASGKLQRKVLS